MAGPFDRFNDRAKRVLALAQDEAIRFNHNYIGPEHLLLGLIREGEGVAARALDALGIELSKVRAAVEFQIGRGDSTTSPSEIVLVPHSKKIIELAIDEARQHGQQHVGTEHLLLGIVRDGGSVASNVLASFGLTMDRVRERVITTMGMVPGAGQTMLTALGQYSQRRFGMSDASAEQVIALATQEAKDLGHDWLGSEHLLLALLLAPGMHSVALHRLGLRYGPVREQILKIVPQQNETPTSVTLTPDARTILAYAQGFGDGTGNGRSARAILLALISETTGIGALVLAAFGATPDKVRTALLQPPLT